MLCIVNKAGPSIAETWDSENEHPEPGATVDCDRDGRGRKLKRSQDGGVSASNGVAAIFAFFWRTLENQIRSTLNQINGLPLAIPLKFFGISTPFKLIISDRDIYVK